jgi:DNA-binding transcriptional LysR family regulator
MSDTEWLRSFLAVYRAGSVTDAAYHRGISQPAVSQHLAALERAVGSPLFVRKPGGVEPTNRGRDLYAAVTEPLDALETLLRRIHGDQAHALEPPVRVGTSPEFFAAEVVPQLAGQQIAVVATFASDDELFALLDRGELDLAVTSTTPPRRALRAVTIGAKHFVLVVAKKLAPNKSLGSVEELATWVTEQPWASYSLELPITRRFWQNVLGRPFPGQPHLVAPDLRAVLRAVELGVGVSLLPTFVCAESLAEGRIVEPYPVSDLVPEEPWFACSRAGEATRPAVKALLDKLAERPAPRAAAAVDRHRHAGPCPPSR